MWVFDGEEWTEENGGETPRAKKPEPARPRFDERMPELQVVEVEIVPLPRRDRVPPFPLP